MKSKLLLILILLFSVLSYAQNKKGFGNVSANSGIPVSNAIVLISPVSDTNSVTEYTTDKNGNYFFDIESEESSFFIKIIPSNNSLTFLKNNHTVVLNDGDDNFIFDKVDLKETNGVRFIVVDTLGNPVDSAKVWMYRSEENWEYGINSIAQPFFTNDSGFLNINSLHQGKYWFTIKKGYINNRFTINNFENDTNIVQDIIVNLRDLSQNEFYLCGICDNKTWITDSIVIYGNPMEYDAESKLLSDSRWYDSNGNRGLWWFNEDETKLTYNYDSSSNHGGGTTIDALIYELTDDSFVGKMKFFGISAIYYMSAGYDNVNLTINANDTVVYLNDDGTIRITEDNLFLDYENCFNCDVKLSKTSFDINDLGNNEVTVTLTDRCGNVASDTFNIIVKKFPVTVLGEVNSSKFNIYPNPVQDIIYLSNNKHPVERVEIYSVSGNVIDKKYYSLKHNVVVISNLNPGIYILRLYTGNLAVSKTFIKE